MLSHSLITSHRSPSSLALTELMADQSRLLCDPRAQRGVGAQQLLAGPRLDADVDDQPDAHGCSTGAPSAQSTRESGARCRHAQARRYARSLGRWGGWVPVIELPCLGVLRRAPRLGVVRGDVGIELGADLPEQVVVAHLLDGVGELVVGLHQVDVDVVEHEQAAVAHPGDARQLGLVGLAEDPRDLLLGAGLDAGDDHTSLDDGLPPFTRLLSGASIYCPRASRHVTPTTTDHLPPSSQAAARQPRRAGDLRDHPAADDGDHEDDAEVGAARGRLPPCQRSRAGGAGVHGDVRVLLAGVRRAHVLRRALVGHVGPPADDGLDDRGHHRQAAALVRRDHRPDDRAVRDRRPRARHELEGLDGDARDPRAGAGDLRAGADVRAGRVLLAR